MTGTPQWRIAATMRCLDTRCFRAFLVTLTRCTPQYVLDTRDVSKRQRSSVRRDSTGLCSSLSRSNRPNRFLRRPRPTRPITLRATGLPPAPLARTPHGPGCPRCPLSRPRRLAVQTARRWAAAEHKLAPWGIRPKAQVCPVPVARLATSTPDGTPHLVPVVFALGARRPAEATGADVIYTAVDAKRKRRSGCAGSPISSTIHGPACSSTAMPMIGPSCGGSADGVAAIHRDGEVMRAAYRLLRAKYAQYQSVPLNGPVIAIAVQRWASWHA